MGYLEGEINKAINQSESEKSKKQLKKEYNKLKKQNKEIKKQIGIAKRKKDFKKVVFLTQDLRTQRQKELENKLTDRISIRFNNTTISVKKSYLKRIKNKEKYIENIYVNKTETQIKKLIEEGNFLEADGLTRLLEKGDFSSKKAKEKAERISEEYSEKIREKAKKELDIKFLTKREESEENYTNIVTSSGNLININII